MMAMPTFSLSAMPLEFLDLAAEDDVARVGAVRVDAAQHLHEGGLARAVLSDEAVDLVFGDAEAHVAQGFDAGEGLGDVLHLENGSIHDGPASESFSMAIQVYDLFGKTRVLSTTCGKANLRPRGALRARGRPSAGLSRKIMNGLTAATLEIGAKGIGRSRLLRASFPYAHEKPLSKPTEF